MTCSCILDYNTVAAADKFGNIAIVCIVQFEHHSIIILLCLYLLD